MIIFYGETREELEERENRALAEVRETVKELLHIETSVGLGTETTDLNKLYHSCEKAKAALELKWLLGGSQVIRPGMLDARRSTSVDVAHWADRVLFCVKGGDEGEIDKTVRAFAQELREMRINRNRAIIYMQNLLLTVVNTADLTEEQETEILKDERKLMNRLYT